MKSKINFWIIFCLISSVVLSATDLFANDRPKTTENSPTLEMGSNYQGYNLIFISLGNVGTKYMSLYGYHRKTTPLLDDWTKDAIVFNNAYVPASWTLPVGASIFTSLQPYSHKVLHRRHNNILDKNIPTLPQILQKAGYKTAAFTGGLDYDPKFGHMRGFVGPSNKIFSSFVTTINQSTVWLNENKKDKFFLFIHGYDAHCPFNPPEKFKGTFSSTEGKKITINTNLCYRGWETNDKGQYIASFKDRLWDDETTLLNQDDIDYLRDLYDDEVLYEDYLVNYFLNSLDKELLAKTIIVIFADHGELFAKQGRFGRAGTVRATYDDAVVHVPLIIKIPGFQGKKVDGLVQMIDLMPTILSLLDIPVPSHLQGKNLIPMIKEGKELNPYVFGGTKYWVTIHYPYLSSSEYIRDKEWKLIRESRRKLKLDFSWLKVIKTQEEKTLVTAYQSYVDNQEKNPTYSSGLEESYQLYNIRQDPDEVNNLYKSEPKIAKKLKKELSKWTAQTTAFQGYNSSKTIFSNEKLKKIREGGYW